jgi:two-component system nitrogen regulation response regulator NtrX
MPEPPILADSRRAHFSGSSEVALELAGRSPAVARAEELVRRAAARKGCVLIAAPIGTDVESVVRELHSRSVHAPGPFVSIDCEEREPGLAERQLFGQSAGSPEADLECVTRDSRILAAGDGTLFLKNIGDLAAATQARLARVVRDGEVRVDGRLVPVTFRLIASALPGLDGEVTACRFRSDLYRRLSTSRIDMPPLSERAEDVPLLAARLLDDLAAARGLSERSFTKAALALLSALTWPGNLAELRSVIDRALAGTTSDVIQVDHVLPALQLDRVPARFVPTGNLRGARLQFEREYIAAVLQHHRWRLADAAETLGIQRPNLYRKARQLGIPLARVTE